MPDRKKYQHSCLARRSSRRLQGLSPVDPTTASRTFNLPTELQFAIIGNIKKRDLKNVRLVSKALCSLATTPLFDRVYVSTRQKDMKVFERITGHPILSAAVQEVVFDTSRVKQMSFEQYFYRLCFDAVLAYST